MYILFSVSRCLNELMFKSALWLYLNCVLVHSRFLADELKLETGDNLQNPLFKITCRIQITIDYSKRIIVLENKSTVAYCFLQIPL